MNIRPKPILLFFALSTALTAVSAQTIAEVRIERLEETIRTLERRVSLLEEKSRQPNASAVPSSDKGNWRRLQRGMSGPEVERLLGPPSKVKANVAATTWHYGHPLGGYVSFGARSQTLDAWSEP
jgi:hypothetical protein